MWALKEPFERIGASLSRDYGGTMGHLWIRLLLFFASFAYFAALRARFF
jgi:hypothetical protein